MYKVMQDRMWNKLCEYQLYIANDMLKFTSRKQVKAIVSSKKSNYEVGVDPMRKMIQT